MIKARIDIKDHDVDHRNGDTLDNRRKNLKKKTRSQNCHGFRRSDHEMTGIVKLKSGLYRANIMVNYVRYFKNHSTLKKAQRWRRSMKP